MRRILFIDEICAASRVWGVGGQGYRVPSVWLKQRRIYLEEDMKQTFRYKNIFMYASLQFCGHIEEYFATHTEKLVVYIVMPRLKNHGNLVRIYNAGKLIEEKKVWSSDNIFLYYISWYVYYLKFIFSYFSREERLIVLSSHPISFLGMTLQRLLGKITYVYWVGDYFPPTNIFLYWYERLKKYYHSKVAIRYYLSEGINQQINGRVIEDATHKTLMWGVKSVSIQRTVPKGNLALLFVGLIKPGQGLEKLFTFLRTHKEFSLKIIGICNDELFSQYQSIITGYSITKQVFFPNKFYSDEELLRLARSCHIGIALYDISPLSSAYYTDPGKIKSYAEMNLPIIMSNTSGIAPYIKKFHAGELISEKPEDLVKAIEKITREYSRYLVGLKKFNAYFYFESYYEEAFRSLERI